MKTQISNKALDKAFAVRDLNVVLFKDEIGQFSFNIKTDSGIDEHVFYVGTHGQKFSDHTPAKWADMIVEVIATEMPKMADPETTETPESAPLQNEPELQAEINDKLHEAFEEVTLSPMMKQFNDLKAKHPDAVLLFRCGDFYETYGEDAKVASEILGITLTKSSKTKDIDGKPLAMAGFPAYALDMYLPKLVRAGKRIAICDQLEDPKKIKHVTKEPKAETTPEVATEAPVSTPTEPEKPAKKSKDKVVKSLDEQKVDILEKLGKQIANMYRKFNVTARHNGDMIILFMKHVDDTNNVCSLSLNVFANGEIKVYTSVPEVFTLESSAIQMEYYLRLNYLLQDGGRQAKVREYVKNALASIANLDKELVA